MKSGVLIADDHGLVRDGLRMMVDAAPDLQVVALAADGAEAVQRGLDTRVDLALLDVAMPKRTGLQAARELTRQRPDLRVLMLSMHNVFDYFLESVKAGASGYVLKHSAPAELVLAIRAALEGKTFITPSLTGEVLQAMKHDPKTVKDPVASLTPRQREILQLIAEGRSAKEIAVTLGISPRTVEFHKYQMMESLHIRSSAELTHFAIKHGIVKL